MKTHGLNKWIDKHLMNIFKWFYKAKKVHMYWIKPSPYIKGMYMKIKVLHLMIRHATINLMDMRIKSLHSIKR